MADGSGREIVTAVAEQVEDAHDKLGDLIEHGGVGTIGPTLDALSALAAAGPLLRLGVANGEVVDAVTSGRTAQAVKELHDAHTAELARALDVETPVAWHELIEAAARRHPPMPTLSPSSILRALGDDPVIPHGWRGADVLDRVRQVRDQALEARDAERERINLFAAQLAGVLFGPSPEIAGIGDWGTPIGLDSLLTAARQLRAGDDARVELATALGLFDVLPAWPDLLDRVREQVRLARAATDHVVENVPAVTTGAFVDDGPVESLFGDRAPDDDHGPDR